MQSLSQTARWLGEQLREADHCELISDGSAIPVVAFRLARGLGYTEFDVSHARLRGYGWQVPAYTMPDNANRHHLRAAHRGAREGCPPTWRGRCTTTPAPTLASLDKLKPRGHYKAEHFAH